MQPSSTTYDTEAEAVAALRALPYKGLVAIACDDPESGLLGYCAFDPNSRSDDHVIAFWPMFRRDTTIEQTVFNDESTFLTTIRNQPQHQLYGYNDYKRRQYVVMRYDADFNILRQWSIPARLSILYYTDAEFARLLDGRNDARHKAAAAIFPSQEEGPAVL